MNNFQRNGSISNAHVGREFEKFAQVFFDKNQLQLSPNLTLSIGIGDEKKPHAFDLGSETQKVIVECKSHTWTSSDKVPSAKLTVWNEAMYYFVLAPKDYRKILFVLKDFSQKREETLALYYIRTHSHLIPSDVEFWEYDDHKRTAERLL